MNQLKQQIKEAKKFGELSSLINRGKYFAENEENDYDYYAEWIMNLDNNNRDFATIANYGNDGNLYHITTELVADIEKIKAIVTELNDKFSYSEISRYSYYSELESVFDEIKVKNSCLEEL